MVKRTFYLAILLLTGLQLNSVCQAQATNLLLNGYMMQKGGARGPQGKEILDHLQGQQMRSRSAIPHEWVQMCGIFKVPEGTNTIRFFLKQAWPLIPHLMSSCWAFSSQSRFIFKPCV